MSITPPITRPSYLIELGFTPTFYLSTSETTIWNSITWTEAPIRVGQVSTDAKGDQAVSVTIANHDRVIGSIVLKQVARDKIVKIWARQGDDTPVLIVDGIMDGAKVGEFVDLSIISRSAYYGSSPRYRCFSPIFNHLPQEGVKITWGSSTVDLGPRD